VWPSRALGLLYCLLYAGYGTTAFKPGAVSELVGSATRAKVYLYRLRKLGWAYPFRPAGSGAHRLLDPSACALMAAGRLRFPETLRLKEYLQLIMAFSEETARSVRGVISLALYGSVARGTARADSDVDLLVVIEDGRPLRDAFDVMLSIERAPKVREELSYLRQFGIRTHLSLLPLSVAQLRQHPPILLDLVEDAIVLFDDGTLQRELEALRGRLRELGAKRVFIGKGKWYWDLMPNYRPGMEVEL
jgi:predicted nucleotidyltransferase